MLESRMALCLSALRTGWHIVWGKKGRDARFGVSAVSNILKRKSVPRSHAPAWERILVLKAVWVPTEDRGNQKKDSKTVLPNRK
ncbi:hypothetical protein A1353_10265 [Methylomonas methanica]|uniref:Uncharacterized protein n=1 Tax=Methylomonas methanica TaxID=421 RepID=A0A177MMF7_METMH|nr:hypothetical protein A1353_10265 [Methylomonas methanica]